MKLYWVAYVASFGTISTIITNYNLGHGHYNPSTSIMMIIGGDND